MQKAHNNPVTLVDLNDLIGELLFSAKIHGHNQYNYMLTVHEAWEIELLHFLNYL